MNACIVLSGENKSGILFAEDFDDIPGAVQECADINEDTIPEEPAAPPAPTYSQEELDAAIAESVSEAIGKTRSEMENVHQVEIKKIEDDNKEKLQSIFESINENIGTSLRLYSENLSREILTTVVAAFPVWSNSQEKLWCSSILEKILLYFSENFSVCVKIHPDACEDIKEKLFKNKYLKDNYVKFVEDSYLNRTDFEIQYSDGKIFRHIDSIVSNILTDLSNSVDLSGKEEIANG